MSVEKNLYTHGHHESVLRSHSWRTAENSAGYLLPQLRPGMSLLDVGAGPGTITADLAALVEPGQVTALEASAAALDITQATVKSPNVDFVVGDVHQLDIPERLVRRGPRAPSPATRGGSRSGAAGDAPGL